MSRDILGEVSGYYSEKIRSFGPCAKGVDWNSEESQRTRFEQVLKVIHDPGRPFTVNDLGCGYGALYEHLAHRNMPVTYRGHDVSPDMVRCALERFSEEVAAGRCSFSVGSKLETADYTVASGIFNVKQEVSNERWLAYVLDIIAEMNEKSVRGFAFNMLTKYSDPPFMKQNLFYADPCFIFDHCMRSFSRSIALLHDYGLYEFTVIVRKS